MKSWFLSLFSLQWEKGSILLRVFDVAVKGLFPQFCGKTHRHGEIKEQPQRTQCAEECRIQQEKQTGENIHQTHGQGAPQLVQGNVNGIPKENQSAATVAANARRSIENRQRLAKVTMDDSNISAAALEQLLPRLVSDRYVVKVLTETTK